MTVRAGALRMRDALLHRGTVRKAFDDGCHRIVTGPLSPGTRIDDGRNPALFRSIVVRSDLNRIQLSRRQALAARILFFHLREYCSPNSVTHIASTRMRTLDGGNKCFLSQFEDGAGCAQLQLSFVLTAGSR